MRPWVSILFYYKVVVLYRVVSCLEEAHAHTYIHIIQDEKEKITHRLLRGKHPTPTKDDDDNDDCIDIAVHSWNQHPPPTLHFDAQFVHPLELLDRIELYTSSPPSLLLIWHYLPWRFTYRPNLTIHSLEANRRIFPTCSPPITHNQLKPS